MQYHSSVLTCPQTSAVKQNKGRGNSQLIKLNALSMQTPMSRFNTTNIVIKMQIVARTCFLANEYKIESSSSCPTLDVYAKWEKIPVITLNLNGGSWKYAKATSKTKTLSVPEANTYYVKVRVVKKTGGKTYKGAWSKTYKVVNTPIENGTSVCSDHFPIYADFTVTVE